MKNHFGPIAMALAVSLLLAACAAMQQQKAQGTHADTGEFHNLQVLAQNTTHDDLIATMRGYSRALGTRCDHCHAANPTGSAEALDFSSDAKPEKKVAREMMRMVNTDNREFLSKVGPNAQMVTCNTCHRGHTVPDLSTPAAEGTAKE